MMSRSHLTNGNHGSTDLDADMPLTGQFISHPFGVVGLTHVYPLAEQPIGRAHDSASIVVSEE